MPYQVRADALVVVAIHPSDALRFLDELSTADGEPAQIRDWNGHDIDAEFLRSIATPAESNIVRHRPELTHPGRSVGSTNVLATLGTGSASILHALDRGRELTPL